MSFRHRVDGDLEKRIEGIKNDLKEEKENHNEITSSNDESRINFFRVCLVASVISNIVTALCFIYFISSDKFVPKSEVYATISQSGFDKPLRVTISAH